MVDLYGLVGFGDGGRDLWWERKCVLYEKLCRRTHGWVFARGWLLGGCELKMHSFSGDGEIGEIGRRFKLSSCPFVHSSDR